MVRLCLPVHHLSLKIPFHLVFHNLDTKPSPTLPFCSFQVVIIWFYIAPHSSVMVFVLVLSIKYLAQCSLCVNALILRPPRSLCSKESAASSSEMEYLHHRHLPLQFCRCPQCCMFFSPNLLPCRVRIACETSKMSHITPSQTIHLFCLK